MTANTEGWFQVRSRVDPSNLVTARRTHSDDDDDGTGTYGVAEHADWQPGLRVLAPWEPAFRYAGHIVEVNDDSVHVEFEDGGSGWVKVMDLRPFELKLDQAVMCRREQGPFYFAGRIVEVRGNDVRVRYEDGEREWSSVAFLRFTCEAPGSGIKVVAAADWQGFYTQLAAGARVWAPWNATELFAGTVTRVKVDKVHIHFDDGDEAWVLLMQLLPLAIPIGLRVLRPKRWSDEYVAGTITHLEGARVLVRSDDDFDSWSPLAKIAVPCVPIGPNARITKEAFRWNPLYLIWLIGAVIGFGILILLLLRTG